MNEEACAEMDFIIEHMDEKVKNKIPQEYKDLFKNNKKKDYVVNLNTEDKLYEQDLLYDTKVYLAAIYRNFICSDEEKREYEKIEEEENIKEQEKIKKLLEKDIFYNEEARKNFEKKKEEKNKEENMLIGYKKENLFYRIIKKILKFGK